MVHGEMRAFSAPELSRSRFLGAALEAASGTTGILYRRLTGTTARLKTRNGSRGLSPTPGFVRDKVSVRSQYKLG